MKLMKVLGVLLIFTAGYLAHITVDGRWPVELKIYVIVGTLFLIHVGVAAMLAKNGKSFMKNFIEALAWPLRGF